MICDLCGSALALIVVNFGAIAIAQEPRFEDFQLNIKSVRIIEQDYRAATSIRFGEDNSRVGLQIGAAVRAKNVDIRLKDIYGNVRFQGNWHLMRKLHLQRVDSLINAVRLN